MLGITDIAQRKLQLMERPLIFVGQVYFGFNAYITWSLASNIPRRMPSPLTCTTVLSTFCCCNDIENSRSTRALSC